MHTYYPKGFTVKCWIKTGVSGINEDIDISSAITFPNFKAKVASVLGIREAVVELCYYFSFAKDKVVRQLTSEKNWETLVTDARQYRNKPTTKRAGNTNSWSVQLKEVGELMEGRGGAKVCLFCIYRTEVNCLHRRRHCQQFHVVSHQR